MLKKLVMLVIAMFASVVACDHGMAVPTPKSTSLSWDQYTDQDGVGFYVYWRPRSSDPSAYSNANRYKITDVSRVSVAISELSSQFPSSSLCFVMTAYDRSDNESDYSNEVCGFIGFRSVTNVRTNR